MKRKKLTRLKVPMVLPKKINERWSIDYVSDQLANGRRFRVVNIVGEFTLECFGQLVDTLISGLRMTRFSDTLGRKPKTIVCDNGTELMRKAMFFWTQKQSIKLRLIQPGKST